ncbi:MAG: hypothetical protein ACI4OS_00355, partial [Akkermansia sp.]
MKKSLFVMSLLVAAVPAALAEGGNESNGASNQENAQVTPEVGSEGAGSGVSGESGSGESGSGESGSGE